MWGIMSTKVEADRNPPRSSNIAAQARRLLFEVRGGVKRVGLSFGDQRGFEVLPTPRSRAPSRQPLPPTTNSHRRTDISLTPDLWRMQGPRKRGWRPRSAVNGAGAVKATA
jgi:hypothetical protein